MEAEHSSTSVAKRWGGVLTKEDIVRVVSLTSLWTQILTDLETFRKATTKQFHHLTWQFSKDTGLATKAVNYIHEPVMMHYVLDPFQQLSVPHVLVVRLSLEAVNNCSGRAGTHKTSGLFYWSRIRSNEHLESNKWKKNRGDSGLVPRPYLETKNWIRN